MLRAGSHAIGEVLEDAGTSLGETSAHSVAKISSQ